MVLLVLPAWSQDFELIDKIYDQNIRTPNIHLKGLPLSQPIVDLNSTGKLVLSFDDLADLEVEYFYTIYHCTADWELSELEQVEYVDGYDEGEIYGIHYSGPTQVPYTHYRLHLPNEEIAWKLSGNYIIYVYYYDGSVRIPVLTRRFMVVESEVGISATFRFPINTELLKTHQELAVTVNTRQMQMRSPEQQLKLYIYQNGNWERGISDQRFDRYLGNSYSFDRLGKYTFPALKEYRHLNNRYINSPAGDIMSLERDEDGYYAVMYPDDIRWTDTYFTYFDLNGQFLIQNKEEIIRQREVVEYTQQGSGDSAIINQSVSTERYIADSLCLNCEYVRVLFSLRVPDRIDNEVYIYGGLSDWQLLPRFKMTYDPYRKAYFAEVLLKQGYYDYVYAIKQEDGSIDTETLEGNWHETENDYLMLVYDRHNFNRYDRLIGARVVNSSQ